ncbi:hypothetical protein JXA47_02550 [Candidatus Sumerlaeota bacterium]|nr:hypothetical protein [Candidatus Sumerlaeota bacterium]
MDELLTDVGAEWLVAGLSALLLVGSLAALALTQGRLAALIGARTTVALVALGPLIYALWWLDAALISTLGFDTLLRVAVEALIFVVIGLAAGLWLRGDRRARPQTPVSPPPKTD